MTAADPEKKTHLALATPVSDPVKQPTPAAPPAVDKHVTVDKHVEQVAAKATAIQKLVRGNSVRHMLEDHGLELVHGGQPTIAKGWVTVIAKDGHRNLSPPAGGLFSLDVPLVVSTQQPLVVRAGAAITTDRLGSLSAGTLVRVLESTTFDDGTVRTRVEIISQAASAPSAAKPAATKPAAAKPAAAPAAAPAVAPASRSISPAAPVRHATFSVADDSGASAGDKGEKAALRIQTLQRGHSAANLLKKSKSAAITIEKVQRGRYGRDHLDEEVSAKTEPMRANLKATVAAARLVSQLRSGSASSGSAAGAPAADGPPRALDRSKKSKSSVSVGDEGSASGEAQEGVWTAGKWLASLGLHTLVAAALRLPDEPSAHFEYMSALDEEQVRASQHTSRISPYLLTAPRVLTCCL